LALLNPNNAPAVVQVTVYNESGVRVGIVSPTIPAGGRFSKLLSELMGGLPSMTRGYFQIYSGNPVFGFSVFGTKNLGVLAAIPPSRSR
jgi:hypothetical protein